MENKQAKKFPEGVLEHIANVISNNLTGYQIIELLSVSGFPQIGGITNTKWKFIYDTFKDLNVGSDGERNIISIVLTFCDPTRWIGREDNLEKAIISINQGLKFNNLKINEEFKITNITETKSDMISVTPEDIFEIKPMLISPIFHARNITQEKDICFVLMPFKPSFDRLYQDHLKPTILSCGFKCFRADDLFSVKPILEDIWEYICKSKIVIADVTGRNPNVFYEMGVAHTLGRPVIIITQDKIDIPFDIVHLRYYTYSDDEPGWELLRNNVREALKTLSSK